MNEKRAVVDRIQSLKVTFRSLAGYSQRTCRNHVLNAEDVLYAGLDRPQSVVRCGGKNGE